MIDAKPIPETGEVLAIFSPKHGRREHAGTVTIVSAILGAVVSPWFLLLTAFVGANQLRRGRRLRIELARCRQGRSGGVVEVEIDEVTGAMQQVSSPHETPTLYPATQLAHPTSRGRSARA